MSAPTTVASLLALAMLLASGPSLGDDEHAKRAKVPSNDMRRIAGELFPDKCGWSGERCTLVYDARGCPLQFIVSFPLDERVSGEPSAAWVTVNPRGAVIEVASTKGKECRNGIAS
ncbi:hypothetical protein [Usitatibacter rugosus]|nr:hypothetical protein [Usitatibacter rugosus]